MIKKYIIQFLKFIRVIPKDDLETLEKVCKHVKSTILFQKNLDPSHPNVEHYNGLWGQLYGVLQAIDRIKENSQ